MWLPSEQIGNASRLKTDLNNRDVIKLAIVLPSFAYVTSHEGLMTLRLL